jgi:SAM-dependent methyltransferase
MNEKLNSVEAQRIRYDREAVSHEKHHAHELNQRYRDQFIRDQILDIDLAGKEVLDGMCASGIETGYLLSRQARVTGLDISGNNIALYQTKWGCPSHVASIHETGLPDNTFDWSIFSAACTTSSPADETMREMHRIVRPGGYLVFVEPNRDTFVNKFRELWYKTDKRFQAEERALSYPALAAQYSPTVSPPTR